MVCKKWEKVHPRNFGDFRSVVSQPCISLASPRRCSSSRSFFLLSRSCCWLPTHARTHTYKMGDRKAIELKLVRRASGSMLEIRCGSRPVRLRPLVGVGVRAGGAGSWWRRQVVDHHPVRAEQIHRGGTPAPQSPSIPVRGSVWGLFLWRAREGRGFLRCAIFRWFLPRMSWAGGGGGGLWGVAWRLT